MSELKGIQHYRKKLSDKRNRVLTRYKFYEMKNSVKDFQISTPPELMWFSPVLGWCAKSVDALSDRLVFRGFEEDNFNLTEIFNLNNPDVFGDSAILGALISSCSFAYISDSMNGPQLQVIDGGNATGDIDTVTGLLNEGYAVLKRDKEGRILEEAYFTPKYTEFFEGGVSVSKRYHKAGYPLLVPIINRPDAVRPFGHSRISRACMSIMGSALRTIKRSEISAEFYSFPQKYVLGLSPEAEFDKWHTAMSYMAAFDKDSDGDHPLVGQFQQQSMTPHVDQLRSFAALFAGETGLTLDDLGFATENPSSAEAIKASHENLRLAARKAQRTFGRCFLNVGFVAACLRDGYEYRRSTIYRTRPVWEPLFEPDFGSFSTLGDGLQKLSQAAPGYFGFDNIRNILGVEKSRDPFPVNND